MVLISSKKYACETCIKGHRSSACQHTDRPLFEIKKKGRPVTQCEHCRELRKTKQVHVKCICEAKEPPAPAISSKKKGTPTLPAHAAFPHGVADVGSATASDSDHGGSTQSAHVAGCSCNITGGECHCCTPRTRPGARSRSEPSSPPSAGAPPPHSPSPTLPPSANSIISNCHSNAPSRKSPVLPPTPHPTPNLSPNPNPTTPGVNNPAALVSRAQGHHILARLAELRPVLPRLSARDAALMQGAAGQHDLFHHSAGHHPHHNEHFSPYGRAYEHALHPDYSSDASNNSAGFYKQDSRSTESLLSVGSLASVASHPSAASQPPGKGHRSQKSTGHPSVSQKSHSQKSPSYDGQPSTSFFGVPSKSNEVGWRLPPSLSRSVDANGGESFPSASDTSYDNLNSPFAPRPRSEGGEVYSFSSSVAPSDAFALRPRSEAAHPRTSSDPHPQSCCQPRPRSTDGIFGGDTGVRMCGCGDGCACPGCALHNVSVPSVAGSSKDADANSGRHCADPTMCGGACLECTAMGISDFGAVVGFGANEGAGGSVSKAGDPFADAVRLALDGIAAEDALKTRKAYSTDLDLREFDGYNRDLGELEGYDLPEEMDVLDQQRQSAAIDEWIREVGGALPMAPPPASGQLPFEFDPNTFEGFDASALDVGAAGGEPTVKMEFDPMEFDLGQTEAWMFDVRADDVKNDPDVRMAPPPVQGLTGGDAPMPLTNDAQSSFLSVPGPEAGHGRSRSSSFASSEVSLPTFDIPAGVNPGMGVAGGAGPSGVSGVALGQGPPVPPLDPHPSHGPGVMSWPMGLTRSSFSSQVPALTFTPLPPGHRDKLSRMF
ncbi:ACE1 transcriptional factor [Favolaschia claudopus]|uniref:ACE1 transcriptional factor n=1 Tax=Favolaschia claudopus TaxID=2862362 RepID=A0AAW0CPS3_9AGAR